MDIVLLSRAALPNKDGKGIAVPASNGFAASMRSAPPTINGLASTGQPTTKGPSPLGKASNRLNDPAQNSESLGCSPSGGASGLASLAKPPAYSQQRSMSLPAGI